MSRGCEFGKQASRFAASQCDRCLSIQVHSGPAKRFYFDKLLHSTIFVLSQANISTSACNQHLRRCHQHLRCADFFPQERYQITFRTATINIVWVLRWKYYLFRFWIWPWRSKQNRICATSSTDHSIRLHDGSKMRTILFKYAQLRTYDVHRYHARNVGTLCASLAIRNSGRNRCYATCWLDHCGDQAHSVQRQAMRMMPSC